ncbi:MAG: superoxide dismutase family protein [Planctomycetota bacterium]|nr:MAG: superoxide dismutase family protein [Planctomycetota bacterium]
MKKRISACIIPAVIICLMFSSGCCLFKKRHHKWGKHKIAEAIAVMKPTVGNQTRGIVRFTRMDDKVKIVAQISGLKPNSKHGFHIHEFGDFSSMDAASAGGHYNPEGFGHAGPDSRERHAGDLGNLVSDANGEARFELVVDNISINGKKNPVLGRGVVIHAGEDDLKSQPTGNAGPRLALGVIGIAKASSVER